MRNLEWFKHGVPYDVRFTGFKINLKNGVANRCWNRIVVWVMEDDKIEVIRETTRQARLYGYSDVTIDHMTKLNHGQRFRL